MRPADKSLLEEVCDTACDLEECLKKQLPDSWKSKGCDGEIKVTPFVHSTAPSQSAKNTGLRSRCQPAEMASLTVRIEADTCKEPLCAAGIVEYHIKQMFNGTVGCCCVDMTWIDTDRSIDPKTNKEIRSMRFTADNLPTKRT